MRIRRLNEYRGLTNTFLLLKGLFNYLANNFCVELVMLTTNCINLNVFVNFVEII